jgi:hypothetical protein
MDQPVAIATSNRWGISGGSKFFIAHKAKQRYGGHGLIE